MPVIDPDRLSHLAECGRSRIETAQPPPADVGSQPAGPRDAIPAPVQGLSNTSLIDWQDLWGQKYEVEDWLIAPFVARGRGHVLFAPAKAGKSLFTLYVAAAAATGRPVLGHPGGEPVRVLYLDFEMTPADLRERLSAMGFGPHDDLSALAYRSLITDIPPLDSKAGGEAVVAMAVAHGAELVIIDTMSRVLEGEENSSDTVRAFYRFTGAPLKALGIAVLRLDHVGKDRGKGMRGSSAKADDVDLGWELHAKASGRFELTLPIRRIGWAPATVELRQFGDPLRYEFESDAAPRPGVDEEKVEIVVALLDRLGVGDGIGRNRARAAISEAGATAGTAVLAEAVRRRQERASDRPHLPTR